jgi:hypothetical protein
MTEIRRELPSGAHRTSEMANVARQILSLLPVPELDVADKLLSPRAGQRLTAYLSLMAEPDPARGEELIETLTEREGISYNQSWALRALSRILDVKGSSWISSRSVAMLSGMRDGLRAGSDRQLMLTNLVDRIARPVWRILISRKSASCGSRRALLSMPPGRLASMSLAREAGHRDHQTGRSASRTADQANS